MTVDATAASPLVPDERFALPPRHQQLTRAADALARRGFAVEILDDAGAARARIRETRLDQGYQHAALRCVGHRRVEVPGRSWAAPGPSGWQAGTRGRIGRHRWYASPAKRTHGRLLTF